MLTSFEQVRDWILDNGFKRWVLYRDRSRNEKIIDSAAFTVSDMEDKISMTEKYLRMAGGNAYAAGATTMGKDDLTTVTEIRLADAVQAQPTAGVGNPYPALNEDAIIARVRKEVEAEYDKKEYQRLRADLDRERKQFDADKNSAIGAMIHYFAPIGQAILSRGGLRNVAGVDTDAPVTAEPVKPIERKEPETQEPKQEDVFTDEESDKMYELMVRFKKVEPDYMRLIERVVEMAESGDGTYTMAKGFLLK